MSPKICSLAVDELKRVHRSEEPELNDEPQLKVLINGRYAVDSSSKVFAEPAKIRGKITVSF